MTSAAATCSGWAPSGSDRFSRSALAVLALVAAIQLRLQGGEELQQGAGADRLAGGLVHDLPLVAGGPQRQQSAQEIPHRDAARVVAGAHVLAEDLLADVIVQLELDQRRQGVVVVLGRVVVEMALGAGVAQ